jgi:hypothetical protein
MARYRSLCRAETAFRIHEFTYLPTAGKVRFLPSFAL